MNTTRIEVSMTRQEWIALLQLAMSADPAKVATLYGKYVLVHVSVHKNVRDNISMLGATHITVEGP